MNFMNTKPSRYEPLKRFERKFICRGISPGNTHWLVKSHFFHFREAWPERYINNIYFDTKSFYLYQLSHEGLSERRKIRVRWYGNSFCNKNRPSLEIKLKKGLVVEKSSYQLEDLDLNSIRRLQGGELLNFIPGNITGELYSDLRVMEPVLFNRYCRKYFTGFDKNIRLTIDRNVEYLKPRHMETTFLPREYNSDVIIELKYPDHLDDTVNQITQTFPFRLDRMSKYVHGIELLYGGANPDMKQLTQ